MSENQRKEIAVIFGGASSEYYVSLKTAYTIIKFMDKKKYAPVMIGITQDGEWNLYTGSPERIPEDQWYNEEDCQKAVLSPCRSSKGFIVFNKEGSKTSLKRVDAIFPALHGKYGEDGTLQGLVQLSGLPLIGCDTISSALCMDKNLTHKVAAAYGILVPRGYTFSRRSISPAISLSSLTPDLTYPLFVKPLAAGSSYGVSCVHNDEELKNAVTIAFEYDERVIIEEKIPGFEIGCAIIKQGDHFICGLVDEIELAGEVFDYSEKNTMKTSKVYLPARIDESLKKQAIETAIKAFDALKCTGFARLDFFLTPDKKIILNEINTMPGFTENSRFPRMLKGIGLTIEEIISKMIESAF